MRRRRLVLIAAALASTLAAAGVRAQGAAAPLYDEAELVFVQHMMVHHEQALVMCRWVAEKAGRQELMRFARYVERAQAAEIAEMQSLLDLAVERGIAIPEHHLHGDPPMAGMLSFAQMEAVRESSGAEFERRWLEGMILHHEGAVTMARAQQQRQLASGRQPYEIAVLVEDLLIEQRAEIAKMRAWLAEWALGG
jgi:uncharacterized protein (DUF305 family)